MSALNFTQFSIDTNKERVNFNETLSDARQQEKSILSIVREFSKISSTRSASL